MILYAHRGNISGPVPSLENTCEHIQAAIDRGFNAEIDVHAIGNDLYLGHDYPQNKVSLDWLLDRQKSLLLHAKTVATVEYLAAAGNFHYFAHFNDPCTITSNGFVWLHNLSEKPSKLTVVPLISLPLLHSYRHIGMFGVCTDYAVEAQRKFNQF